MSGKSMATLKQLWSPSSAVEDGCTPEQLAVQKDALRQALARVEAVKVQCSSCTHFDLGHCRKHEADIPAEFQEVVDQCAEWRYDGIPF